MTSDNQNPTEGKEGQNGTVAKTETELSSKVALSGTSVPSTEIQSAVDKADGPVSTKVRPYETLMEKIGNLEAALCFYTMEVEELGTPLGRLRTTQAYFQKMEHGWGCHRNLARRILEEVLLKKGLSERTIFRLLPAEQKDPIKRMNRLGKTRQPEPEIVIPISKEHERVGCAYQDPD